MHYENGHEVSQQLAAEVYQLAFANTKAWTRRESVEETYMCQHGNLIALKLHAEFDCVPEVLLSVILNRQHEWDLNLRSQEILEEYDIYNKIKLLTLQMPMANRVIHMCVYFCVAASGQPNQFHIVYQSIDHDRIPPYDPVVPVYPSGFFIAPIPEDPNKCQLTSVFQFPAEYPENPKVIASLATSSERIIAGLRGVVARFNDSNDNWDQITNDLRKTMYNSMLGLDTTNGWSLRFQRKGLRSYTKQYAHEFRVATRTTFSLPYRSHEVAAELFYASQNTVKWDQFVTENDSPVFMNPSTFIQVLRYGDLQEGTKIVGHMLCSLQSIKDNVCDITYKISYEDPPSTITGWVHGFMPSGGFIVHPVGDNPRHSTVQCMVETRHTTRCSDEQIKRESVRVLHYWNSLVGYVSAKLRERIDVVDDKPPQLLPNVKLVGSSEPYHSVMDAFSRLVMQENIPTIFNINLPESSPTLEPLRTSGKRKHLMSVDDVVFTNPRNVSSVVKPFLFLVSDEGLPHRFLRRRLESPLVGSRFDSLPQEIIIEVFKFLDPQALDSIARTCTHFKELVISCNLWRSLYTKVWGDVKGRVALRYCGDDDPDTFFNSFLDWKELFLERQYIEAAWEAPERRALSFTVTKAHARAVQSMDLLPSRHRLVTGSQDRLVRVWDVTSGACLVKLQGTSACVSVASWGETHAKVGYKDGVVRVFDVMNEDCISEVRLGDTMRGCIFSKNSVISWHDTATHWDETTAQPIATFTGHIQRIKSCAVCPAKNILYTASRDCTVRLWDLHNQTKVGQISGHTRAVNAVALIGPNLCVSGSSDKLAKVWDIRKLNTPLHVLSGHTGKLKCIKFADIGEKICTGGDDGVNLWRSTDFSHIRKDFEGECVVSIAVDEESVAYGGINGQIQYYDFTPHR